MTRADATLEEMVDYLRWLEPCWDLRERFHYQNHLFGLASLLVERVSGKPWGRVVCERIFEPLGMTRAYTAWREYERYGSNYAHPLVTLGTVSVPIPSLSTDSTACAGSLSMSVRGLLRWGQANLAPYADASGPGPRPLISPQAARELHRSQTPIRLGEMAPYETPFVDSDSYGLGWFVETYRGVPLVHHGGTINGFKSMVAFLPEHDCALAVLVNQNGSPVPMLVARMVVDAVLGVEPYDWRGFYLRISAERRAEALREYRAAFARRRQPLPPTCSGVYTHPAYGTMRIMNDLGGPRLRYKRQSNRLRPGTATPWALDTGALRLAIPCSFEGSPPTFCAWLEPELKTPIRFERVTEAREGPQPDRP
jgi:CubicO group peptidase (beta-lactamase class C family)